MYLNQTTIQNINISKFSLHQNLPSSLQHEVTIKPPNLESSHARTPSLMRTKLYLALLAQLRKAERLWAAPLPSLVGNFEFSLQIEFAICTPTCAATLGGR